MTKPFGTIVNVSSIGANFTFPGGGACHATKYAIEAISDALRSEVHGFGVDVVIIQPGLIRTEIAASAGRAAVGSTTQDVYAKGPLAKMVGEPDSVAKAIKKAITAKKPPLRIRVTPSAHLMIGTRKAMSDRMWDRFLAGQFPRPA